MSKIVVCASGYFNPLHFGHVSFLQKAKDAGTSLLVIVNNDKQVALRNAKMDCKPETFGMPARDRVRLVRSLACVDLAIEAVDQDESVAETLRLLHPDLFANGGGQHATPKEAAVCRELGIRMIDGLGIEVLLLKPFTQHYDWGKPRRDSAVAALAGEDKLTSPREDAINCRGRPYAELWMGDHPSGPASVKTPTGSVGGCLISMLKRSPSVLGEKIASDGQLPFLMKVLSIEKALSIQAHPDRALAARLHRERPDVYKDANHKPEIAIALTDFEALCGFRPPTEIVEMLDNVPELAALVGTAAAEDFRQAVRAGDTGAQELALKAAYSRVMRSTDAEIRTQTQALVARASAGGVHPEPVAKAFMLATRLYGQFGDDIGIFSVFFLNFVQMKVAECLYMPQNTPHAYLSGDIVECMACSDNVVRGGLTPKYKDIDVLCEMLVYRGGAPPMIEPEIVDPDMVLYRHGSLEEFQVTHMHLEEGKRKRYCFSGQGPSLGFAWKGSGSLRISDHVTRIDPGVVFLLAAGVDAEIIASSDLDCFVACCPPHYFAAFNRTRSERNGDRNGGCSPVVAEKKAFPPTITVPVY